MEQQKLLWIIFSVAFFSVVVVIAALIFLKPPTDVEPGADNQLTASAENSIPDSRELLQGTESTPDMETNIPEEGNLDIVFPGEDSNSFSDTMTLNDLSTQIDVTLQEDPSAAAEDSYVSTRNMDNSASANSQQSSARVEEPRRSEPVARRNTTETKPTPEKVIEYWIQVASLASKSRAEDVQYELAARGINTVIFTKEQNDTLFYRLRNGPYANHNEADKFLEWIQSIKGFEESWKTEVTVYR